MIRPIAILSLLAQLCHAIPYHQEQIPLAGKAKNLVPITLGVMSRCPDAHICEATMDRPMSATRDLIQPELVFIAELNETATYGVSCKHGPSECRGNIQQLCMIERQPWQTWWSFSQCMRFSPNRIGDDSLARECSKLVKVDWGDDLQSCVDGEEGRHLLQASVEQAKKRDIRTSCSIYINDKLSCIRDDGAWRQCTEGHDSSDFVRQIKEVYRDLN